MARRKKGRPISGVLLIDKPLGFSSNQILQKAKWLYQAQKAGHTGTLDPAATGLLPICFGEATKFSQFLLDAEKAYLTTGVLGVSTETLDAEGEVTQEREVPDISESQLQAVLSTFTGDIEQVPPMYSALKRDGKKLYELAREGIEVEIDPRPVTIKRNDLLRFASPEFDLDVQCSKGTYIRTLVADIGEEIGCGAHVKTLRRTRHGQFNIDQAISLEVLEVLREAENYEALDALLVSLDELLADLPRIDLDEHRAKYFSNGNDVNCDASACTARVYLDDRFLGVGRVSEQRRLQPERLVSKEVDA
ncbi:tRNA pseudouridine(55) synthase TruB [Reinekea forsetii]|nr:tRNA pseudouridine(55) synthase TruB [Reinekea forsetii]